MCIFVEVTARFSNNSYKRLCSREDVKTVESK